MEERQDLAAELMQLRDIAETRRVWARQDYIEGALFAIAFGTATLATANVAGERISEENVREAVVHAIHVLGAIPVGICAVGGAVSGWQSSREACRANQRARWLSEEVMYSYGDTDSELAYKNAP